MARGSDIAVGCIGMVIGAGLTVAVQVYAAYKVSEQIASIYNAEKAKGASQAEYDRMCSSGAWKHDAVLRGICEDMKKALQDKNGVTNTQTNPASVGGSKRRRRHG